MRPVDANMIEQSRRFLDLHYAKSLSNKTRLQYKKLGAQYFGSHRKIRDTRSSRTYYVRKAALAFYAAEQLIEAAKVNDQKRFRLAVLTLEKLDTPLVGFAAIEAGGVCPILNKARRKSKRASLKDLPPDWRDQMLKGVSGLQREWLLLLAIVGLRPDEIANGVIVEPVLSGIKITIQGSKLKEKLGQAVRVIYSEGAWETELAAGGQRSIDAPSANAVSAYIGRRGQQIFPRKTNRVSSYTYRHQVASDLKASGLSGTQVSAILGHAVDLTKKLYGSFQQSRRNVSLRLISATNEVKIKPRSKKFGKIKHVGGGPSISL